TLFCLRSLHDALPISVISSEKSIYKAKAVTVAASSGFFIQTPHNPNESGMPVGIVAHTCMVVHNRGSGLLRSSVIVAPLSSRSRSEEHTSELQSRFDI